MRKTCWLLMAVMVFLWVNASFAGVLRAGRVFHEKRDARLKFTLGQVSEIEGGVEETKRAFYDATDQQFKQDRAENFDLNDFNVDDGYTTIGLAFENANKFFTFQFDAQMFTADASAEAKRNYYIGVGDGIDFNGQSYENMKIEEGTPFDIEMTMAIIELRCLVTPFTIQPSDLCRFTPWFGLGIFSSLGQFDIDAGDPKGVVQYLFPPEDFVVGGSSSGMVGVGAPELSIGGQLRLGGDGDVNVVLQGTYSMMSYSGDTGWLVSSRHREKNIDLDHSNIRFRADLEVPMGESGRAVSFGVQMQTVETEGSITSKATTEEEIIERRERFDKEANFKMELVAATIGLTF